ncbi:MAG: glycoside hydrolase 43 family protein [Bacteroidetes bacterium]|jgi:beta-xylosidase|nr:glycoside hydrolase 43 family protein [Bacteroidota bacterium]
MIVRQHVFALTVGCLSLVLPTTLSAQKVDRTYTNPVILGDYSDPDAIRVGDRFFLTSSSFNCVPGLPILTSTNLVEWSLVGHALTAIPPVERYRIPRHGEGVWAPALRMRQGRFHVFYGDPDVGIVLVRGEKAEGPWEEPIIVRSAKGWIDPCPFWDDDGNAYLVHAWAKSRVGFNAVLTVRRMSPDGTRILDDSVNVFYGGDLPAPNSARQAGKHPTIEGPKFYKRNGWYYIFAPAGGVATGWQTVLRSRNVFGPYDDRIVMRQGATAVNGPHQGAWVEMPDGTSWFLHFQDRGTLGRVVHLQPMRWVDDWPVIGDDPDGGGTGKPVMRHTTPARRIGTHAFIPTSDEFSGRSLGLQWQWHANPDPSWAKLHQGRLDLSAQTIDGGGFNLWKTPHLLLQKFSASAFTATTDVDVAHLRPGERLSLVVMGMDYAALVVERTEYGAIIGTVGCRQADKGGIEELFRHGDQTETSIELRADVIYGGVVNFSYRTASTSWRLIDRSFLISRGRWIGAKVGLTAQAPISTTVRGRALIDRFLVVPR